MRWQRAIEGDSNRFRETVTNTPGWYWILRPKSVGPMAFDVDLAVRFLVHVDADGAMLSPVADLTGLDDVVCYDSASDTRFATHFAGPVTPGESTATVKPLLTGDGVKAEIAGSLPRTPGWHWCRTDPAPLALVGADSIGPVFLEEDEGGNVQVFLCDSLNGKAVDVGEFGFSEPLVSRGGVIDSGGTVGRETATFYGPLDLPEDAPVQFRL